MVSISQHVSLSGHDDDALFKWHCQWHWIDKIIKNYVILVRLKSETMGKLINRIHVPGSRLLISIYQAQLWEGMFNRLAGLAMSTSVLNALPDKWISKDTHLVFSIYGPLIFLKIKLFRIYFFRYTIKESDKQLGFRSGLPKCHAWSWSKQFAKVISRGYWQAKS